ncbi:Uncharacterised protein [Mycobacteroides abscessus subsp. abscessus]|nr:Uncharacterised protein [Mycobacteroides abscessus subsp. abscessus]SIE95745.1 Uncharacterised protein [Mycobacteroides abscessus subsp. abscessus]
MLGAHRIDLEFVPIDGGIDLPYQGVCQSGQGRDQQKRADEEPRIEVQAQYDRCESPPHGVRLGLASIGPVLGISHGILVG